MNSNINYNCRCDIAFESNLSDWIAIKYDIPYFLAILIRRKEAAGFEYELEQYDDTSVYNALNACIAEEWGEGVVIVEQEIARRGLHIEDNEGRFEL
jgi:hypothetical protein